MRYGVVPFQLQIYPSYYSRDKLYNHNINPMHKPPGTFQTCILGNKMLDGSCPVYGWLSSLTTRTQLNMYSMYNALYSLPDTSLLREEFKYRTEEVARAVNNFIDSCRYLFSKTGGIRVVTSHITEGYTTKVFWFSGESLHVYNYIWDL